MYKLLGVLLLVVGGAGFSFCICRERLMKLVLLKEMKYMYQLIQNEIRYSALPLPRIFEIVSEKISEPFAAMLKGVSQKMDLESGEELKRIWQYEVHHCFARESFAGKQKEMLLRFPACMGLAESEGQARAVLRLIEETDDQIRELSRELKSQNKVIMSLGISAGVMLSILLL